MNELAVIPLYDWLYDDKHAFNEVNGSASSSPPDTNDLNQIYHDCLQPSHFVALLKKTPNRPDLKPLTAEEILIRDRR